MALTQDRLAEELGVRQQTVSEWETGVYRPRGASERLLTIIAERAGYNWGDYGSQHDDHGARAGDRRTLKPRPGARGWRPGEADDGAAGA